MNPSDLIGIGRLGGQDAEGYFQVLIKSQFRTVFAETDDIYLIFNSDRVFFVTISERNLSDRKFRVKFAEDGIADERKRHKEAILAIPAEHEDEEEPDALIGYTVVFLEREVGKVKDYFHNNAQYVLVVETTEGKEILVPWVDHYVSEIIADPKVVVLCNAESLLEES